MSRDLFVQDLPADARTVGDIPADWAPTSLSFDRATVEAAVLAVVPSADFADPNWGRVELPEVSIEINVGDDDPLQAFAMHVHSDDADAADPVIREILGRLGVRAFDTDAAGGIFE